VNAVHFVVPAGIDDPALPSGGNAYDRRVLAQALARIPDGSVVLLDGLIASPAPEALVPESRRLRLVALVHMPLGRGEPDEREQAVLSAVAAIVTTSAWARRALLETYSLPDDRVHVAEPGVEAADLAPGTPSGGSLLSVAAVIPGKGHDVLVDALAALNGRPWRCLCVGSVERDPAFVASLRRRAAAGGMNGRLRFAGAVPEEELARRYGAADLLVLPSRSETYGMVVTEALARGLPVVAADVGGVPEAMGHGADGSRPGVLVPPEDPGALGDALRAWLGDAELRGRLRRAARERRESLTDWSATTSAVADVLARTA
jgi:glycosyltransferase involved in cell wall biosynthesis